LNEVSFDSLGVDGSKGNGEWIELYLTQAANLKGYSLRNSKDELLYTFGALQMPADGIVLILLSDVIKYPFDADPNDGRVAVAADLPNADHLGNDFGGVRLLTRKGKEVDSLSWGIGAAPIGNADRSWFDISFGTGNPIGESDSLARALMPGRTFTGGAKDWDRHGGRDSIRATPGRRNGIEIYNVPGMLVDTQIGVSDI